MPPFQAGERRMRPIFLTSSAASVGVLPMMIENNTLWSSMGAVILQYQKVQIQELKSFQFIN